jgi:hypothetical protein
MESAPVQAIFLYHGCYLTDRAKPAGLESASLGGKWNQIEWPLWSMVISQGNDDKG